MFGPNILADRHADSFAVHVKRLNAAGRFEIAIFIENIVGRQKRLVRFAQRFAALQESGRVMKRLATSFIAIDKTHEQRCLADARVKFFQDRKILRDKTRFKDEVLRRISADGQFRRQNQFRARSCKTLVSADDQFAIASQIPYGRVNLSKTNLHAALRQVMRNGVTSNPLLLGPMGSFLKPFVCRGAPQTTHALSSNGHSAAFGYRSCARRSNIAASASHNVWVARACRSRKKNRLPARITFW